MVKSEIDLYGPETENADLDALRGQTVAHQLVFERDQPGIQLVDPPASHRYGRVEQQETGTARLGIVGELGCAERDLLKLRHSSTPWRKLPAENGFRHRSTKTTVGWFGKIFADFPCRSKRVPAGAYRRLPDNAMSGTDRIFRIRRGRTPAQNRRDTFAQGPICGMMDVGGPECHEVERASVVTTEDFDVLPIEATGTHTCALVEARMFRFGCFGHRFLHSPFHLHCDRIARLRNVVARISYLVDGETIEFKV